MMLNAVLLVASMVGVVDLSGAWRVMGEGLSGDARLPGTLASAQLGKRWTERDFQTTMDLPQSEALVQEWQYVGKTVWTRTVTLSPEECARPLELFLERVMWTSAAFWDGRPLGTCDSLATPHVYALPKLTPGRHELRLEIDNGNHYGFSRQSHAYGPNMQAIWNGVLGKVELRRVHSLRQSRVFAAWPANRTLRVEVPDSFAASTACVQIEGLTVASVAEAVSPYRAGFKLLTLGLGAEPRPWQNAADAALYTLVLRDAAADFTHRIRFGFRSLGVRDHALTLNGHKIFTRGNVENANFAKDGTPWMTKAEWAHMLKTLRDEDGVDTIRFHTWCPPGAAFEAAEELGMFLQPEAGIWTDGWMSEGDEIGNGKPVDAFVRRELKAIVDAYGNSPALLSLSIGNELGNSNFPKMGEMVSEVRAYDPRTLYYASSARELSGADDFLLSHKVLSKGLAREKLLARTDWDYEDLYGVAKVPVVAHEIGQWPVYPLWDDLLTPFTGVMRPWNLSRHRDTAAKKNALRFQREYHVASAKLNRLIYKEEVESFLRTPSCAGLQLLNVQDYTGQAEALVGWRGPFYDLKAGFRDLPSFATVWGPVSYLARFPKFTYVVGETFRAKLQIRNLTAKELPAGTEFVWSFAGERHPVRLAASVAPGEIGTVATAEILLTDAMTKAKQTLSFGSNRWDFWVYPRETACPYPAAVVVTKDVAEMKAALASGKTVLYTGTSWKSAKGRFKSVYWSARWFPVANTTSAALGTWFDTKHPVFRDFVTDDFTDWQWHSLAEGATIHALKNVPDDYRPLALSVNDFHFSDLTATMFEMLVGRGRLFVCGYDLEAETPEARRLRACVCAYLAGAPAPGTARLPETWLADEFDAAKPPDLSGAVYDCRTNWVGRTFRLEIRGVPPTTGEVVIDGHQPETGLTSGRGILDDHIFEVPFSKRKGEKTVTRIPVIREDFLDGKLELEVNLMTGSALGIDRIRIVPKDEGGQGERDAVRLADVVVVAPDASFGVDRMGSIAHWGGGAAHDLTNALAKVLGKTVLLYRESEAPRGTGPVLYLGDVAAARAAGVADPALRNLEYRLVTRGGNVFIWSRTGTGASYGVSDFLERFCGYRFLTTSGDDPYELRPDAAVPPCDIRGKSAIYRHTIGAGRGPGAAKRPKTQRLWPGDRSGFLRRVCLSLREEDIEGEEQLSEQTRVKCHSSFSYLPPKKYWKDHPEYYCMDESGKRFCLPDAPYANGQLCYSNPEVRRLCLESLLSFIEKDRKASPENPPLVYDLTQQDAMKFLCLCPDCKKIIAKYNRKPGGHEEGGDAGLQLEFVNELAREVAKKYPGVQLRTFAYVSTEVPPAGGIRPEDNVIIWMCDLYTRCNHMLPLSHPFNLPRRQLIADWAAITKRLEIWDYMLYDVEYSRGRLFPEVSVDAVASDAKFFRDLGLQRLYMETEYADQPFWELNVHVMSRCYRDPDYDLGKAIDEYCTVYGKGAPKMREAIDLLRETILANPPREWQARILSWRNIGFYERLRKLVAAAYALEDDRVKRARIARVLACIDDELAPLRNGTPAGRAQAKRDRANWFAYKLEDALAEFDDLAGRVQARAVFEKQVADQKALDELRFRDMPPVTEGQNVDDIFCIDYRRSHAFSKFGRVEDDPASETGKTIFLASGESSAIPLACGVSDTATWKRFDFTVDCSAQPEDGRYRWHRAGEATLRRGAFFWFPKGWKCRFDLNHCFVNCDGMPLDVNRFAVWVSIARRDGRLAIDRIVLRRIDAMGADLVKKELNAR